MPGWLGWLSGLVSGQPPPGTRESLLEQRRLGALLQKESAKPPGQRDAELVYTLCVDYHRLQLENEQANMAAYACRADEFEHGKAEGCCAANGWVRQRVAASYRALHDYSCQFIQLVEEEIAAAVARRPPLNAVQPALHLDLPEPLQQQPSRLDMCSKCAEWMLKTELVEQSRRLEVERLQKIFETRAMQAAPDGAAASLDGAGAAAAAGDVLVGEAQHTQHAQQQQHCGSCSGDAPSTPRQPPLPPLPQQQHTSLE